jgi:multisubunit Na+/H+ antiporter MnhC subunit
MSASLVLIILMAALYASGVYLLLGRSMTRMLLGFLLVGNATNLLILIIAGPAGVAPIVADGVEASEMHDPLPEALILTAIVITFGVSAFLLALICRSWRLARADVVTSDEADVAVGAAGSEIDGEEADESRAEDGSGEDTEFEGRAEAKSS